MKDLETLKIFVRIADTASFTRAAESLGIPKGRASMAVQSLEKQTGVRLLHRTTRFVRCTDDGEAFLFKARQLLADMEDLQSMFAAQTSMLRGKLRVDVPIELARSTIIPALSIFMKKYPELDIELSSSDRRVDLVQEGFDCVLRVGAIVEDTLVARTIGHLVMCNAASPNYLTEKGMPNSLDDLVLQNHKMIHYSSSFGAKPYGWEYPGKNAYRTLDLPGALQVNNVGSYYAAGLAGLGLIQAPKSGILEHLKGGSLVEILPLYLAEPLPVSLVVAHRNNLSKRVRVFMHWLEELLKPQYE